MIALLPLAFFLIVSTPGRAAAQQPETIPRIVADLRVTLAGLPTGPGRTPTVALNDQVPSRALGIEAGAHVSMAHLDALTVGLGVTFFSARSTATTAPAAAPAAISRPSQEVSTRLTILAPQLSLNFGHRLGWSYVSGGLGGTKVSSEARVAAAPGPPREIRGEWSRSLNVGGGARWFINDRLGVSFDLRWHRLGGIDASAVRAAAPADSLLCIGVGLSFQ